LSYYNVCVSRSVKETLNLSQKDYIKKIDALNRSLVTAWDNDQRVKALKIAIQVSGQRSYSVKMEYLAESKLPVRDHV